MTGRFPLFGMLMLSWLMFNIDVDIFTQAQEATLTQNIGCTYEENETAPYCGWTSQNWESVQTLTRGDLTLFSATGSSYNYINVVRQERPSTLTSPKTQATGEITDCLGFFFFVTGVNATLMVSIQRNGHTQAILWRYTSNNYSNATEWPTASLPIKSPEDFRVIIESLPTRDTLSVIAVDQIRHYRNLNCALIPAEAQVDQTASSSTSTPGSGIVSSSARPSAATTDQGTVLPVTTLAYTSPPDTPPANSVNPGTTYPNAGTTEKEPGAGENSTAVLAGAVTVGVVLLAIIVVIVGLVIWKRRSRPGKDSTMADINSDFNTGTSRPPLSSSSHTIDSGYSYVTLVGCEPDGSANPFTLADDEDVKNVHLKMKPLVDHNDDEYNVLGTHGSKAPQNSVPENDTYSHINKIQPTVSDVSALNSQVNKKGKSAGAEHRLALESDGNPLYTVVKNNGKLATMSESGPRTEPASIEMNSQQTGSGSVRLSPENDAVSFQPAAKPDANALYARVQKKGRGVSSEVKTIATDITALYSQVAKPKVVDYNS